MARGSSSCSPSSPTAPRRNRKSLPVGTFEANPSLPLLPLLPLVSFLYLPAILPSSLRDYRRILSRNSVRIHQMANVSNALNFLEKQMGEPLGNIGNEDIVNGDVKKTLSLLWRMTIYQMHQQQLKYGINQIEV